MNVVLLQMDIAWAQPETNIERADENLRTATIGFQEGVITPAT